jgi:hypothetical protein
MAKQGWDRLLADVPDYQGRGRFPIAAYSEFMPPPRIGWRPYGANPPSPQNAADPYVWQVSEHEEAFELRPGLQHIAGHVLHAMQHLEQAQPAQGISRAKLEGNPYWSDELAASVGKLAHERYLLLLPLALSKTQDDKGRVRWTFFGSSEQGPDRAFWKSFYSAPGREKPPEYAADFFRRLLHKVYGESLEELSDLRRAGLRILPGSGEAACVRWKQDSLPSWTKPLLFGEREPVKNVRYLLSFRPFRVLPQRVREAYLSEALHLLPFPGSLIFWGAPPHLKLQSELRLAMQIPLLNVCDRFEAPQGLRILQSGWLHEPHPDLPEPDLERGKLRNTYRRTHRSAKVGRHEDELAVEGQEDRLAHVLFSTDPQDLGLYGKPMARNCQIWTDNHQLLLDGPNADRDALLHASGVLRAGGQFAYRFYFPPMRVGSHEVFWQRPLVAFRDPRTGEPRLLDDAPAGYFTAYRSDCPDLKQSVELWPEFKQRPEYLALVDGYAQAYSHEDHQLAINVHKVVEAGKMLGQPLSHGFARHLVNIPKHQSLDQWIKEVAKGRFPAGDGAVLQRALRQILLPLPDSTLQPLPEPLTLQQTATRAFEVAYWKTICKLSMGRFLNKDNADCIRDPATQAKLRHKRRDLEPLGEYLLGYYRKLIAKHRMRDRAMAGDLPFSWHTDFDYPWMNGWQQNQPASAAERNLLVMIPGRDRRKAIIMADHYDTAYMEDLYYQERGGKLVRLAAAGADDNHSATATLMMAAPVFLQLSRAEKLDCDVWLVHLTGEEFPSDCMGARHLAQGLVEGSLRLRTEDGKSRSLSKVNVAGVFVLDMIAHNHDHARDIFQISPGFSRESLLLAYQAHVSNMIWNAWTEKWNQSPDRQGRERSQRSADGAVPAIALHPSLNGEVRPWRDLRSSLYNTDGQIFSDVGVPVVLFMENYDINRNGYHDTQDTMSNVDLDYGAAVAAIAIETVARSASGLL